VAIHNTLAVLFTAIHHVAIHNTLAVLFTKHIQGP